MIVNYETLYCPEVAPDPQRLDNAASIVAGRIRKKGFDPSGITPEGWNAICQWAGRIKLRQYDQLAKQERGCDYPPRGLLFMGDYGTGKTMLAKILASIIHRSEYPCEFVTADEVERNYQSDTFGVEYACLLNGNPVVLDDLGREPGYRHYGNLPPMDEILVRMFEAWEWTRKPILLTTNLKMTEMFGTSETPGRYGERLRRRFEEMFTKIMFEKRKKP